MTPREWLREADVLLAIFALVAPDNPIASVDRAELAISLAVKHALQQQ